MPEGALATHLFGGALTLAQPAGGHRSGTDAVLLARACGDVGTARVLDLGAGAGAVGLGVARFSPQATVTLIEIDPALAELAARNAAANGMTERVRAICVDALAPWPALQAAGLAERCADLVLTNPPFFEAGSVRVSPDAARARAHVLPEGGLVPWLKRAGALVAPKGRLVVVHRADALPALLAGMPGGFGEVGVLPVLPRAGEPAIRVLVAARKGSRAPFRLLAPLVLHDAAGGFTPEAAKLHGAGMCASLLA